MHDHPSHTQPYFPFGSLDVMGSVCIALGELHTWAVLPFPALKVPSVLGVSSKSLMSVGQAAWCCPVLQALGNKPQTSITMGTTDSLPCAVQAALEGTGAKDCVREAKQETRAPPNPSTAAPLHHCISCSALLRMHCHQPQWSLSLS